MFDKEQYQRISDRFQRERQQLVERLDALKRPRDTKIEPKLTYAYSLIDSMVYYIREAPVEVRCHLIGSIFPEKIEFDGEKYRTSKMNEVTALILQSNNELEKQKQDLESTKPRSVPRAKLITNSFLKDLDKIWALRFIIPDPKKHRWKLPF